MTYNGKYCLTKDQLAQTTDIFNFFCRLAHIMENPFDETKEAGLHYQYANQFNMEDFKICRFKSEPKDNKIKKTAYSIEELPFRTKLFLNNVFGKNSYTLSSIFRPDNYSNAIDFLISNRMVSIRAKRGSG